MVVMMIVTVAVFMIVVMVMMVIIFKFVVMMHPVHIFLRVQMVHFAEAVALVGQRADLRLVFIAGRFKIVRGLRLRQLALWTMRMVVAAFSGNPAE